MLLNSYRSRQFVQSLRYNAVAFYKVLKQFVQLLCSLFCASEIGCYSYSFEDGICQLGAFHGSPVGQSSNSDKKCYVDAKGGTFEL